MSKNIAVIFGGVSNENEISVITGTMAANVLISGGDRVIPIYIAQTGEMYSGEKLTDISSFKGEAYKNCPRAVIANGGIYTLNKRGKTKTFTAVDVVLNCCHGGAGEGGGVSGVCALASIPLASAGIFESAAFMDKYLTKLVLQSLGVKTVEYVLAESGKNSDWAAHMPDFPVIVKPVSLGSSIGVAKAENEKELEAALETAFLLDSAALIEKYVENRREINCAAYLNKDGVVTSECEEAIGGGSLLSFEDKYAGGGKSVLPAHIAGETARKVRETTAYVYEKLNMRGIVRFDYILDGEEVYLSEINTVPGSLSYYLLSKGFKDFYRVLSEVIEQAEDDFNKTKQKKIIRTGILENISSNACKLGRK